jgi:hypothetical protein
MRSGRWIAIIGAILVSVFAVAAQAQTSNDTIRISSVSAPLGKDTTFSVLVSVKTVTPGIAAFTIPLTFAGHPNLTVDTSVHPVAGVKGISFVGAGTNAIWVQKTSLVDFTGNTILIGLLSFSTGLPAGTNDSLLRVHFKLTNTNTSAAVNVDTTVIAPSNHLTVVDEAALEYTPKFVKGVITIGSGATPPTITLNPTALAFNGVVGAASPANQTFTIMNTGGGTLNWTLIDDQPWLSATPASGTGNDTITVTVNTAGLASGPFTSRVIVSDPAASNTPETVLVTLNMTEPNLIATPGNLNFIDTAGTVGVSPPQTIILNATSSAAITWTSSKLTTWLLYLPTGGTTPDTLSVNVDISGLAAGLYRDTITITSADAANSPYKIPIALLVEESQPDLSVSPTTFDFNAVEGGINPPTQPMSISNVGGGALNWSISGVGPWSTASSTAGTGDATVDIGANITGLAAGSYTDTITVSATGALNSPQEVIINLTVVEPQPSLSVSPTTFDFTAVVGGPNPATQPMSITNAGGGTLDWSIAGVGPWSMVSSSAGTGDATVDVGADITGLVAGSYTDTLTVSATGALNSPQEVIINLTVTEPPALSVSPTTADFNAPEGGVVSTPATVAIEILNTGGGVLNFTITDIDAPWVGVSALSGTAPDTIFVSADPTGLAAGTYQDGIQVVADGVTGSPVGVTVSLIIAAVPPEIGLDPTTFNFTATAGGANPAGQPLNITNTGGGALVWNSISDQPWLTLVPSSGTAPASPLVTVDITGLAAGNYEGFVTVTGVGATNTPQVAEVFLTVNEPAPHIAVNPDSLFFSLQIGGPTPPPRQVDITNTGGGTLDWTASDDQPWLSVDPTAGTAPSVLSVSVDLAGLAPGTYTGQITVSSGSADNSPVTIPVVFEVTDMEPALSVTPLSLAFSGDEGGANPPAQSLHMENVGGGVLSWSVIEDAPWILAAPTAGENDADVSVSVELFGLTAGTYTDTIQVDAGSVTGSPALVVVTLDVAPPPPPSIVLFPTSFAFTGMLGGGNPATQYLHITNGGAGDLNWTATNSSTWLTVSPTSGTAPDSTGLSVDISGLGVGTYYDTVVVSAAGADNSPQIAAVRLDVVDNPPHMVLSPTSFLFEVVVGNSDPPSQQLSITNSGAGSLNWTASESAPWLDLSSNSGTAPSIVDVSVTTSGLLVGTYKDTIVVSSGEANNSPQLAIVTLQVKSAILPSLHLLPDSLYFIVEQGQTSEPQCIYVFIDGNGGRAIWRGLTEADWIQLSSDSCNVSYPVCVTVDAFGFEPGIYCDSVEYTGNVSNGPQYLKVCMDVRSGGEEPILVVTDTIYQFTAQEGDSTLTASQAFLVSNAGGGTLNWTATPMASWVVMNPTAGTAPTPGTFQADPFGLAAGNYSTTVEFDAPGALNSPEFVTIELVVTEAPPEGVDSVQVGSAIVTPGGSAVIPVFFENSKPLYGLSVPLTFASTNVIADSISFAGTRVEGVDITVASIDSGEMVIRIGVIPIASPAIPVGSGLLANIFFSTTGATPNQVVVIDTISDVEPPISLAFVDTTTTEYVPGFRPGTLTVEGGEPPALEVEPDTLMFSANQGGANPAAQALFVSNTGGGVLTFSVVDSFPWFSESPASGSQGDSVLVSVNITGLTQGTYVGDMAFTSPEASNDPVFVTVILEVGPVVTPPFITLTPDQLNFTANLGGPNPDAQVIAVTNTGGGTLAWTATKTQPWLSISPNNGGSGTDVTVTVDVSALAEGDYFDTITFTDPAASNSPKTALVELHVVGPAGLDSVVIASVSGAQGTTVDVPVRIKNTFDVAGITLPLHYSGVGVKLDTGIVTPRSGTATFIIYTQAIDTIAQTALFGFISFGTGMAPGDGDVLILRFEIAPGAPNQVVVIDTTTLPPSNSLTLDDPAAGTVIPEFVAGSITIGSSLADSVWVTDAIGKAGQEVTVDVYAKNGLPIERLLLPLRLTSPDVSIVGADFTGTRSASGTPLLSIIDDQTFIVEVQWDDTPLPAGTGLVAHLTFALSLDAPTQMVYVDTAGDFGYTLPGGSHSVVVPVFVRGMVHVSTTVDVDDGHVPSDFALGQNYPNPFNPSTSISYSLSEAAAARLDVFNMLGRRVATLVDEYQNAGSYTVTWDGRDEHGQAVPSGVYLYRLAAGPSAAQLKMTLLK